MRRFWSGYAYKRHALAEAEAMAHELAEKIRKETEQGKNSEEDLVKAPHNPEDPPF